MKKTIAIFAAFALVFGFAATTMAADWDFYGSARFATFYITSDEDSPNTATGYNAGEDESDLQWALQGNSRIGATVTAGDIGGAFEYGSGPNLRKLYGTWNFGAGELLVGQTYTPTVQFYNGRQPMIQLKMGGFKVALITPVTGTPAALTTNPAGSFFTTAAGVVYKNTSTSSNTSKLFGATGVVDTETTLPKIELAYRFATDMFFVEPMAGYQSYDMVAADGDSESVDSYVLGAYAGVMFGPASIYFGGYFAENSGAYGAFQGYGEATLNKGNPIWDSANNELADNEEMGGMLVVNFKINDMLSAEGGLGYVANEYEVANVKTETEIMTYYANLPIQLADGVFITPEIGFFDFGDKKVGGAETSQGSDTYFGAKWQINF